MRTSLILVSLLLGAPAARADTLVVLNKAEATASLINVTSGKVAATLPTGQGPHEVAASPDGRVAVVANYGTRSAPGSTLTVIDVARAKVTKTIDLGKYGRPHGIQWIAGSNRVAVTVEANRAVVLVEVGSGKVVQELVTGQEVSHMLVVAPQVGRIFVANIGSGSVTVLDLKSGRRVTNIQTGDGAEGIDLTPDGRYVWVTNRAADTVSVIDAKSLKIVDRLSSAAFPIRARITPDGRRALISNAKSAEIRVFDTQKRKEIRTISIGKGAKDTEGRLFADRFGESAVPIGVVTDPAGKRAYVALANADAIAVIDLESYKLSGELRAGREPDGMAYTTVDVGGS